MKESKRFVINERLSFDSFEQLGSLLCLHEDIFIETFSDSSFRRWMSEMDEDKAQMALSIFSSKTNKQDALFEISHILNPGIPLIFGGECFESLKELGTRILDNAPYPLEDMLPLLTKGLILDFIRTKNMDVDRPLLYKEVEDLVERSKGNTTESWFDLGFLLSKRKEFFFEHKIYDSLQDFFMENVSDESMMSSYDFATMPYMRSYAKVVNMSDQLSMIRSLADDTHRKYKSIKKLSTQ